MLTMVVLFSITDRMPSYVAILGFECLLIWMAGKKTFPVPQIVTLRAQ